MRLVEGRADAAEPPLTKALALQPREAAVLYRLGRVNLEAKDYAAAAKHLEAALDLRPGSSSIHYPLALAYRGLGDSTARRRADAAARQRGRASGRSADAAGRRAPAECRGRRSPRRRSAREAPVGRSRHVLAPGRPGCARQRVHAAQPGHGPVPDRRRGRRTRSVSGGRAPVTHARQSALRRRHRHGSGRPGPRSHRRVLGCRQERPGLRRSAHEPGRCAAAQRTHGGIAAALRGSDQGRARRSLRHALATPWPSCA